MRGTKAKRLRREAAPTPDYGPRPAEYTHPIDPGPGRKARRAMHAEWRASVARAARLRDKWAGSRGKGTPQEPIRAAINRLSRRGIDFRIETPSRKGDGRDLMPVGRSRNRWKPWRPPGGEASRGALVPRNPE